jgi:ribosomal protein S13
MARVKNAVAREGIPAEEEAASTPSGAADIPRIMSAWATWTARETLRRHEANKIAHVHPFRGGCYSGQRFQKSRGVAAERTKSRDRKGNAAYIRTTPHPLGVLVKLDFLSTAHSGFGRRGLQTPNKPQTTASRASFEPRMPW